MTETSPAVALSGVNKWFGAHHVLRDVDLTVAKAEKIVICGPSGSGKSTLIRCVNGLEAHQQGTIRVDGTELTGTQASVDAVRREVGMVFQHFNLFAHLTVLENCTLAPIHVKRMGRRRRPRNWRWAISNASASRSWRGSFPASSRAGSSSGWRSPALCA